MSKSQTIRQRKALRSLAAQKGWATRRLKQGVPYVATLQFDDGPRVERGYLPAMTDAEILRWQNEWAMNAIPYREPEHGHREMVPNDIGLLRYEFDLHRKKCEAHFRQKRWWRRLLRWLGKAA